MQQRFLRLFTGIVSAVIDHKMPLGWLLLAVKYRMPAL